MLLSPTLRKIATVALLLPAAVMANSSYADCSEDKSYAVDLEADRWQVVDESGHARTQAEHAVARSSKHAEQHTRLSRRAFYGRQAPVAIIEL